MGCLERGLLQGLLVGHTVGDAFQVAFLCKIVLQSVTAASRGVLTCLSGRSIDRFNVVEIIALQLTMKLDISFQAPVCLNGNIMVRFFPSLFNRSYDSRRFAGNRIIADAP